jgi:hypothetical protein
VIGGQYGEITVAMQYSFQAWNAHIPGKYRDLLFSTAVEEFGHVEMLATMVAQLLEKAPLGITQEAIQDDPAVAAVIGGTDMQHEIVAGAGARPVDSMGNPWTAGYVTASGNLLADMTSNLNAEMQDRIQVARHGWPLGPPGAGGRSGRAVAAGQCDGAFDATMPRPAVAGEDRGGPRLRQGVQALQRQRAVRGGGSGHDPRAGGPGIGVQGHEGIAGQQHVPFGQVQCAMAERMSRTGDYAGAAGHRRGVARRELGGGLHAPDGQGPA